MTRLPVDASLTPSIFAALGMQLLQALWLFAPLLFAGAVAAVVLRFDLLAWSRRPIDCDAAFRGKRLFGDNKTWRGLLVAVVASAGFAAFQANCTHEALEGLTLVEWHRVPAPLFGGLMGLGAVLGELPNSFVKRRLDIAPGKTTKGPVSVLFYVWDQVDVLIGTWPLIGLWVQASAQFVAVSFALALAVHPVMSLIGWLLGVRRSAR